MSRYGVTVTLLANQLIEAVLKDEAPEEGGFDLSAGLFGRGVSDWIRATAKELDDMREEIRHHKKQGADRLIGLCKCGIERDELRAILDEQEKQEPCSWEVYSERGVEFSISSAFGEAFCHEYINDILNDEDVPAELSSEISLWKVRPVYAQPKPAPASLPVLQKLGKRLSELLDEDQFAECEELLLEAGVTPPAGAAEVCDAD